jgi:hypothetical protein
MRRLVLTAVLLVGCHNELRPGRCNRTSDCAAGLVCDLSPTPQGNGRCVVPDGGPPDGDAGGSDGGGETGPECVRHSDCPADHPACSPSGTCVGCDAVPNSCSERSVSKPVCGPAGTCLECASDSDCTADATKPICDTSANACVGCSTDAQCAAKLGADPGVCMSHQDGRCATISEVIYVQNQAGCASASGAGSGSVDMPFCAMQPAVISLADDRRVIVVRGTVQASNYVIQATADAPQITIVGQQNGAIAGGAYSALVVDGANVYARNLTFELSAEPGVVARNSSTIRLNHAVIDGNAGGGLLVDHSAFDVAYSVVTNNGPSSDLAWGGIRIDTPALSLAQLQFLTIQNNRAPGLSCTGPVTGLGILASGNTTGDIATPCGITPCGAPSLSCGVQP